MQTVTITRPPPGKPARVRLLMLWTAPATGIAMGQSAVALEERRESACGYKQTLQPPRRHVRSTPRSRPSRGSVRFAPVFVQFASGRGPVLARPLAKRPLSAMDADITCWWRVRQVWGIDRLFCDFVSENRSMSRRLISERRGPLASIGSSGSLMGSRSKPGRGDTGRGWGAHRITLPGALVKWRSRRGLRPQGPISSRP